MTEKPIPNFIDRETWQADIAKRQGIGEVAMSNLVEPLGFSNIDETKRAYDALIYLLFTREDDDIVTEQIAQHIDSIRQELFKSHQNPFLEDSEDVPVESDETRTRILNDTKVKEFIGSRDVSPAHQKLAEVWPQFLDTFMLGVKNGIRQGYIPAEVEKRLDSALRLTSTRVADSAVLDTYSPAINAYYLNNRDEVGLRDNLADGEYHDDLVHEYTHKISGGTFRAVDETNLQGKTVGARSRVGYATEIRPEELKRTGLNEAVTHHLTLGILTGDFETFDPDERTVDDHTYYSYRKVVGDFITKSQGLIDVKTVTNGFYEDTGPEGGVSARKKFIGEVVQAYGHRALNKLEKLCELSDIVNSDRLGKVVLSRINPPVLDEHGRIIRPGNVDSENLPTFYDLYKTPSSKP